MEVSGAGNTHHAPGIQKLSNTAKPSSTDIAVANKELDQQKGEGAQLIDSSQKAGATIDVTA